MNKPILNFGEFTICFEAQEEEEISARRHFVGECGWTTEQFETIEDFPFFCAKVSIWKDGEEKASDYLGCCSYKSEAEFYKKYVGFYFADMVKRCAEDVGDSTLSQAVDEWLFTVCK